MMSAFLKKLLFVRQFSIEDGKIEMLGKREIMLPSNILFWMQAQNKQTYELSKQMTIESVKEFGKKIGSSEEGMIKNMKEIYETFGLGPLEINDLKNEKKEATITIKDSSMAKEYMRYNKSAAKTGQCELIAGILAGMFSFLFNADVNARETKCLSTGSPSCIFSIGKGVR